MDSLSRWLTRRRCTGIRIALLFAAQLAAASEARFPFPQQQVSYSFGIKPTSQSQATMNSDCQQIYQAFLKYNATNSGCPPNGYRVHCGPGSLNYETRSEGIAWGMLITVFMDNATNLATGAWQDVPGATHLPGVTGIFSRTNATTAGRAAYKVRVGLQ